MLVLKKYPFKEMGMNTYLSLLKVSQSLKGSGSTVQNVGSATEKALSPYVTKLEFGTTSSILSLDQKRHEGFLISKLLR